MNSELESGQECIPNALVTRVFHFNSVSIGCVSDTGSYSHIIPESKCMVSLKV